jgi:hypothetical protein
VSAQRCDVKGCPDYGSETFREVAKPWITATVCPTHAASWPFAGDFYERGERVPFGNVPAGLYGTQETR